MYYEQFITQEGVKATGSGIEGGKRPLEKDYYNFINSYQKDSIQIIIF